jgi:predicted transcriptional regulator
MLTRDQIIETVNLLPDTFTSERLIEQIILIEKIDKGLDDSKSGRVTPDEELDKKLEAWLD